jgi:hypothetical protein
MVHPNRFTINICPVRTRFLRSSDSGKISILKDFSIVKRFPGIWYGILSRAVNLKSDKFKSQKPEMNFRNS